MKRQEERLRKALNWLVHLYHGVSKGASAIDPVEGHRIPMPVTDDEWIEAIDEAMDILDDATEIPEMQRLVVWISIESNKEAAKRSPDYKQALLYVLDYIYAEFGYE